MNSNQWEQSDSDKALWRAIFIVHYQATTGDGRHKMHLDEAAIKAAKCATRLWRQSKIAPCSTDKCAYPLALKVAKIGPYAREMAF
jgi:hypothetical protein